MNTVWKFTMGEWQTGMLTLTMPTGAIILSLQMQDNEPVMWAYVNPEETPERRHFMIVGTGHKFGGPGVGDYVGTFQWGQFVGHVFEVFR